MKSNGSTNINLKKLVSSLKKMDKDIWQRVALDLQKPRRQRREVNLSIINTYINAGETAVIPGKVLGEGLIDRKIDVAAFQFTGSAIEKIKSAGGNAMTIQELIKKNPTAKGVRILG